MEEVNNKVGEIKKRIQKIEIEIGPESRTIDFRFTEVDGSTSFLSMFFDECYYRLAGEENENTDILMQIGTATIFIESNPGYTEKYIEELKVKRADLIKTFQSNFDPANRVELA